jgi:rhodanese-related sulfurtransferase
MSTKKRARRHEGRPAAPSRAAGAPPRALVATGKPLLPESRVARLVLTLLGLAAIAVIVIGADFVFGALMSPAASSPSAASSQPAAASSQVSHWTNITPDQLAQMLQNKDFTLLNVKTPYMGEIDGTDLWIPYDQVAARASELPADKGAKIVVYCRTGTTSAIAAQTLLNLGYTNVWNLEGGMTAWTASGRSLVNKNRG